MSMSTRGHVFLPSLVKEKITKDAGEETITFDKAVGKEISSEERKFQLEQREGCFLKRA